MGNVARTPLMGVTSWVLSNAERATDRAVSFDPQAGFWRNGREDRSLGVNRRIRLVLERPPSRPARRRSPGATKALEHRQRERDGVRCFYVPVHRAVIETLIDRGLSSTEATDPKAIGRELGAVLVQWVERWHQEKNIP
jgi:hypothetical protein